MLRANMTRNVHLGNASAQVRHVSTTPGLSVVPLLGNSAYRHRIAAQPNQVVLRASLLDIAALRPIPRLVTIPT
jgi:hypothetical protein